MRTPPTKARGQRRQRDQGGQKGGIVPSFFLGLFGLFVRPSSRPGYAFLVTVLVIGVMATATATSLMLLGWAAEQNGFLMERSGQAEEYAKGCIERAFRKLRLEPTYAGNETVTFPKGSCLIRPVVGDGVNDRRVCVEGRSGQTTRRFQVEIDELFPRIRTASFAEVAAFTLCP